MSIDGQENDGDRDEAVEYLTEQAWELVAPGFQTYTQVIDAMVELVVWDEDNPLTETDARSTVDALWRRREQELSTPPRRQPTDDVRLSDAFAEMTSRGIVASMNLGFDQIEGGQESRELAAAQPGSRGYAFFHSQDTARLAEPDATLYIGYDAVAPSPTRPPTTQRPPRSRPRSSQPSPHTG